MNPLMYIPTLLVAAIVSVFCSPKDTYYIQALSNTTCPIRQTCMTLSEFAHQNGIPTKNKTLNFLPGEHTLSSNISITNINSCSLIGIQNATSRIKCEPGVGFAFSNILHVRIQCLVFISCGVRRIVGMESVIHDPPIVITRMFALFMDSVRQIEITNSTFEDNLGSALGVNNSRLTLNGHNSFLRNCRQCFSTRSCSCQGGGIYAFNSNITVGRHNSFVHNMAKEGGGIFMKESTLNTTGIIYFHKNTVPQGFGGGIYVESSSLHFYGDARFGKNSAQYHGGGIYAVSTKVFFYEGSSTLFQGNSANTEGGGVHMLFGLMMVDGYIIFTANRAGEEGGAISTESGFLHLTSSTILKNNSATLGGGIKAVRSTLKFNGNTVLVSNSANRGGGIFGDTKVTLILGGVSNFENNTAYSSGGGIYLQHSALTSNVTGNISFNGNFADYNGGGIYAESSLMNFSGIMKVYGNYAQIYGGGVFTKDCALTLSAGITFSANVADLLGGGAYVEGGKLHLLGNTFHSNLAAMYGGGIYSQNASISLTGKNFFITNSAGANGGAVYSYVSNLNFSTTNTTFRNNFSVKGGGFYLGSKSFCFLMSGTRVIMTNNTAGRQGGAIYVEDTSSYIHCFPDEFRRRVVQDNIDGSYGCFFQRSYYSKNIQVTFESNSAQEAGSALYGGSIDNCKQNDPAYYQSIVSISSGMVFNGTFIFLQNTSVRELSVISSYPSSVCPCKNNNPDCETSIVKHQIYPGEKLIFPVVAVGQRNGTASAIIRSHVQRGDTLGELQESQTVYPYCTNLVYTLPWTPTLRAEILLHVEGPCSMESNPLTISLELLPCPIGFSLSKERLCECEPRLQVYTNLCNITERSVQHKGDFWVGYSNELELLILHPHCPFDYCKPGVYKFTFSETDEQCEHNRSGLLCGRCKQGLSLTFATSHCSECSDIHLLLLVAFALAGLGLVFFLLIFKITVASGTLNGLIIYANIFSLNRDSLLSTNSSSFLTVFIAWLNLDFGIPLCFYNGMDAYARTWLQFAFPIYMWIIIGLIILLSNISQQVAKVFGTNPVAVLATLFLVSYAKILRTFTTSVSIAFLEYPSQKKPVWLHDASIGYLQGEHIPLFLVAVFVFLTFYLPYTILLLLGQCFQTKSHLWMFRWVNSSRLNAFMDAYYAPYKPKHRYWTGLLLVIRSIMFLTLGFNPHTNEGTDLLLVMLTALVIHSWAWIVGGVYKNWWLEILEASFILNLGVLAAVTYNIKLEESRFDTSLKQGNHTAAYISLSMAFVTTIGIFLYHIYLQIWNTWPWKICCSFVSKKSKALVNYCNSNSLSKNQPLQSNSLLESSSHIVLQESLLEVYCY